MVSKKHRLFEEEQRNSDWALSFYFVCKTQRKKIKSFFTFFLNVFHVLVPLLRRVDVLTFHVPWKYIAVILHHFLCNCRDVDAEAYIFLNEIQWYIYIRRNDVITFITSNEPVQIKFCNADVSKAELLHLLLCYSNV